ncbi:MAG: glycosyltransferase [Chloroflexi bacterium]|nr:glycosyltransferase [Chloroflexota bacterium]
MIWQNLRNQLRVIKYSFHRPVITQPQGKLAPGSAPYTFVMMVGPTFNQTIPNAATTARMGWCRGFEQLGIPYLFISVFELAQRLPELPNPICWLSAAEYTYLNRHNLAALKRFRHLVWVHPWFKGERAFYRRHNLMDQSSHDRQNRKILSGEPALVFTISPQGSFEYYGNWANNGAHLVSLPLACDTALYRPDTPDYPEFAGVQMAFVGGYWPYKARQFDRYLKPYQDRLTVFGYTPWPYAGYGGRLPDHKEPSLYRQARLSPTINEPQIEVMGIDLNERVFKVLGSGGMTVTDVAPGYREWFSADELLVPGSEAEYHDMVRQVLSDEGMNSIYRRKGYAAVMARHTYAHRAQVVLDYLGLPHIKEL